MTPPWRVPAPTIYDHLEMGRNDVIAWLTDDRPEAYDHVTRIAWAWCLAHNLTIVTALTIARIYSARDARRMWGSR